MNKNILTGAVIVLIIIAGYVFFGNRDVVTPTESFEGIHIMADGSVMLQNGDIVEDAIVTENGMIQLSNGDILKPAMDLRDGGSMDSMEIKMEENSHEHSPDISDDHAHE